MPVLHRTQHTLTVAAAADALYSLVADVSRWPAVFEPTVHVRHLEHSTRSERFEIWAEVNGTVAHWTSRRVLDRERRYVSFRQEHSTPPVTSMSGGWLFRPLSSGGTEIVLRHRFTVADDDPASVAAVTAALDRNSERELAALGRLASCGHLVDEVVFAFSDIVELPVSAAEAYAFVAHAERWPDLLSHVTRVELAESRAGIQHMEMDTLTPDGSQHTTRSVRVCRDGEWIAYKQQITPRLLAGHSGNWSFADSPSGAVATARHTVVINPAAVAEILGPDATLADARAQVRSALGHNSRATLERMADRKSVV